MAPSFVPGPVDVNSDILQAQAQPMLPHRSPDYEKIFHQAERKARELFGTQHRVLISASSGTGLQEAAVRNLAQVDVLSCVNGAFGNRWHQVAVSNGKNADMLEVPWEQPISADAVCDALAKKEYEIITIVHNETSTGMQNPVDEIASAVGKISPETLICVDAVSSLGGAPINMDAWGVDFVLTSSQKALALPPGLALGAVSDRALARAATITNRGWYFDIVRLENARVKNSTPATSAVSLVYALDQQLDRILEEGLENRFARYQGLAERIHQWAQTNGFGLYAPEGYRSRTVTTITNNLDINVAALIVFLLERDIRIANGYGPLKGKTFRIAHMGETTMANVDMLLANIDEFLAASAD
jgi:aspartate aminotransferase-like enzyme